MNPEKCLIYRRFPGFSAPRRRRRRVAYLGILGAKKERRPLPTPPLVFISRLLIMFGLSRFKTARFPLKIQGFPHLPVQSRLIPRFSITLSLYNFHGVQDVGALRRVCGQGRAGQDGAGQQRRQEQGRFMVHVMTSKM